MLIHSTLFDSGISKVRLCHHIVEPVEEQAACWISKHLINCLNAVAAEARARFTKGQVNLTHLTFQGLLPGRFKALSETMQDGIRILSRICQLKYGGA